MMKSQILCFAFLCIVATSCQKNNATPTEALNETIVTDTAAKIMGMFANGPYGKVMGDAKLYFKNGKYTLALENVNISNGPDLHVYLSQEIQPISFIDLGKLKSTAGNQLYDIAGTPDFTLYKYALVHCQQYNHLFGSAALK